MPTPSPVHGQWCSAHCWRMRSARVPASIGSLHCTRAIRMPWQRRRWSPSNDQWNVSSGMHRWRAECDRSSLANRSCPFDGSWSSNICCAVFAVHVHRSGYGGASKYFLGNCPATRRSRHRPKGKLRNIVQRLNTMWTTHECVCVIFT